MDAGDATAWNIAGALFAAGAFIVAVWEAVSRRRPRKVRWAVRPHPFEPDRLEVMLSAGGPLSEVVAAGSHLGAKAVTVPHLAAGEALPAFVQFPPGSAALIITWTPEPPWRERAGITALRPSSTARAADQVSVLVSPRARKLHRRYLDGRMPWWLRPEWALRRRPFNRIAALAPLGGPT